MADEIKGDQTQIGGGQDLSDDDKAKLGQGKDVGGGEDKPSGMEGIDPKLQEFMVKKGFKTTDEVIDFANTIERKVTELSTKSRLTDFQPTMPTFPKREIKPIEIDIPENTADLLDDRDKLKSFATALVEKATNAAKEGLQQEQDERDAVKIYQDSQRIIRQDPEKFERLKPTMRDLYRSFPNASVQDLYDEADRLYDTNKKAAIDEIRKELGLEDINLSDLRNLAKKTNVAPISDSGGATGGGDSLVTKPAGQMSVQEKKEIVMESIFGESAGVLRDDEK